MKKLLLLIPLAFIIISGFEIITHSAQAKAQENPSVLDMTNGLKQALLQGTAKSTAQLSAVNGFFGNAAVKILFPPQAQKAEQMLRKMGLNSLCDNVILSLNRAAEDAASQAEPIFADAIQRMSFDDAIQRMSFDDATNILLGKQDEATQYFKRTTSAQLAAKFRPVIQASLNKVGATKYFDDVAKANNKIPFTPKINPDITDYATQKAIDGIFTEIAMEEINIRKNIAARSTPEMFRVFSFADRNRGMY